MNMHTVVAQKVAQDDGRVRRKSAPSPLIERGGLALVEFHLARRGIDCVRTQDKSADGDIWASTTLGRISLEVKTTMVGRSWHVRRSQTSSEFWCLVHLEAGECHILTAAEIRAVLDVSSDIYKGVACLKASSLPRDSREAWGKLGAPWASSLSVTKPKPVYKSTRRVKQVMADGSTKVYVYPPTV